MYLQHFGLREAPFAITPDPRYLYLSERHREALAHLLYGIGEGGGFVQLTGEVGTGKTTLCRCLLDQLPSNVDVALILNPRVTPHELVGSVCDELRVGYPAGTASLKVLVDALNQHLLEAHARGRRTVVIIDEAQNLDRDVLEQVRLLTNLETPRDKLLQIILIGQPELLKLLDRPELRQLAQRVTARYHLAPLSRHETSAYVRHRLAVSGAHEEVFTGAAARRIYALSGGIPRLVNVICDRALLGSYALNKHRVDAATVRKAAAEALGRRLRPWYLSPWLWAAGLTGAVAAVWPVLPVDRLLGPHASGPAGSDKALLAASPSPASSDQRTRAPHPQPAPTPTVAALHPPEPTPASAADPLAALLSDQPAATDRASAFGALFAQWGLSYAAIPGDSVCERARSQGLQCSFRSGDWDSLRKLNRPAVIELVTPDGDERYTAVTRLEGDRVTLRIAGQEDALPISELSPYWSGQFIILWRPPAIGTQIISHGTRGRAVRWLRDRLRRIDGRPLPAADPDSYDAGLQARVVAFQRQRGLTPDGIVGEQTLIEITNAAGDPARPLLSPPDRGGVHVLHPGGAEEG
jgi:general secretion pathway protein A